MIMTFHTFLFIALLLFLYFFMLWGIRIFLLVILLKGIGRVKENIKGELNNKLKNLKGGGGE